MKLAQPHNEDAQACLQCLEKNSFGLLSCGDCKNLILDTMHFQTPKAATWSLSCCHISFLHSFIIYVHFVHSDRKIRLLANVECGVLQPRNYQHLAICSNETSQDKLQKHKISSLLFPSRCITNYMNTCSFLHVHFTELMKTVENLIFFKVYGEQFIY